MSAPQGAFRPAPTWIGSPELTITAAAYYAAGERAVLSRLRATQRRCALWKGRSEGTLLAEVAGHSLVGRAEPECAGVDLAVASMWVAVVSAVVRLG